MEATMALTSQYLHSTNCSINLSSSFSTSVCKCTLREVKLTLPLIFNLRGFNYKSSLLASRNLMFIKHHFTKIQSAIKLSSNVRREFNTKRELTGDYIAGLVQADGSVSAVLCRKTRGDKEYFHLSALLFTLVQNQKYKELILEIQKKRGNIGH